MCPVFVTPNTQSDSHFLTLCHAKAQPKSDEHTHTNTHTSTHSRTNTHTLTHTHTRTHQHKHAPTQTHTHTHTHNHTQHGISLSPSFSSLLLSPSCPLSLLFFLTALSVYPSIQLSLSLSHTHTRTQRLDFFMSGCKAYFNQAWLNLVLAICLQMSAFTKTESFFEGDLFYLREETSHK